MRNHLPPLNALRVFEVAAQYESFTRAATVLNVTQSAVSKQVALLEIHLGQSLFIRGHKSLKLTVAGRLCAQGIKQSLDILERKLNAIDKGTPQRITILTDVDFARLWLFPMLPVFERLYPDVLISLKTKNYTQPIASEEEFDLAISWGRGNWTDLVIEPLFTNEVFPVCAPDFFGSDLPDMIRVDSSQLIHDRDTYWWQVFLGCMGVNSHDADAGRMFTQTALCLDAAARGDGVAIGDEVTSRAYLETGALIVPFPDRLPSPDSYYMLARRQSGFADGPVRLLRDWLVSEATKHRLWFSEYWAASSWP